MAPTMLVDTHLLNGAHEIARFFLGYEASTP